MKRLVKEILYEKFVEDSDPVRDLDIGLLDKTKRKYNDYLFSNIYDFNEAYNGEIEEKICKVFECNDISDLFFIEDNTGDRDTKIFYKVEAVLDSGKCKIIFNEHFNSKRSSSFWIHIIVYDTPIGKIGAFTYSHGNFKSYFGDISAFLTFYKKV